MAKATDHIKIKGVGFNEYSEPDTSIITNETFEASGQWLILSSYSIPKDTKVYMELVITENTAIDQIRHLPIYLGIHKEPSSGILNTDCIFMSLYYSSLIDFEIFEKYKHIKNGSLVIENNNQEVGSIKTKLPITNAVLGIGVDVTNNTITIFNDGKEFYSFSPELYNLADEGDWYFAIYSKQSIFMKGKINFGRYKTECIPDGYYTLYQLYYPSLYKSSYTVPVIEVDNPYEGYSTLSTTLNGTMVVSNDSFPIDKYTHSRDVYLEHSSGSGNTEDTAFQFLSNRVYGSYDMSTINLPCPINPVYCEIKITSATLNNLIVGIPIEVGLTVKKNNYTSKSFRVCLYHMRGAEYQSFSVYDSVQQYYLFPSPKSPIPPVQPNTVGIIFDRAKNLISLVTGGRVFVDIPIQGIDTSKLNEDYYIFFKSADEAYTGTLNGYLTLGDDGLAYDIPRDGVSSVYDYWNAGIYYELDSYPEIRCRMNVQDPYIATKKDIYCQINVPKNDELKPGLNMLFDSLNTINDTEPHMNEPDTSFDELKTLMESDGKI